MDPDYIDPEVLKARARGKGNRPEDVKVGRRPRLRRPSDGPGVVVSAQPSTFSAVRFRDPGVAVDRREAKLVRNHAG